MVRITECQWVELAVIYLSTARTHHQWEEQGLIQLTWTTMSAEAALVVMAIKFCSTLFSKRKLF